MKTYLLSALALAYSAGTCAQLDSTAAATTDSTVAKSTLTLGAIYANNASYYGQRAIDPTPYAALAATYRLKCGLYFSGLTYKLLHEKTTPVSAGALGIGIAFPLIKKISGDLSYSHSFYPSYSPFLQAANTNNASAALSYENGINISITGDYAFGKTSDAFVTAAIGRRINFFSLGKKDIVTFTPSINAVAGTQHFYESYITEKKLRDSVLGLLFNPITGNQSGGTETKTVATTAFAPLSYSLKCPLAYNRASYLVEAAYQLSFLSNQAQNGRSKTNSFFTLSFYYQL